MTGKDKLIVHKSNPLLNMKNDMGLYLQRLFNLYLAAINPLKEDTKTVKFTLSEFVLGKGSSKNECGSVCHRRRRRKEKIHYESNELC